MVSVERPVIRLWLVFDRKCWNRRTGRILIMAASSTPQRRKTIMIVLRTTFFRNVVTRMQVPTDGQYLACLLNRCRIVEPLIQGKTASCNVASKDDQGEIGTSIANMTLATEEREKREDQAKLFPESIGVHSIISHHPHPQER
jgi:hypothetical protein